MQYVWKCVGIKFKWCTQRTRVHLEHSISLWNNWDRTRNNFWRIWHINRKCIPHSSCDRPSMWPSHTSRGTVQYHNSIAGRVLKLAILILWGSQGKPTSHGVRHGIHSGQWWWSHHWSWWSWSLSISWWVPPVLMIPWQFDVRWFGVAAQAATIRRRNWS